MIDGYVVNKMMGWIPLLAFCQLAVCYTMMCNASVAQSSAGIRYSHTPTTHFDWDDLDGSIHVIKDSLTGESIQQFKSQDDIPLFYSQKIATSVCFDNQCRPFLITVYWNITGRYLGFSLPEQEFLSRYDHEPFSTSDYELLHKLLADPYLPFGDISFEALIDRGSGDDQKIDGISGATSTSLAQYVVKGAAYTTYTLWNIIYGPTQDLVEKITEQEITPKLVALILRSPSNEDRIWGLNQIDGAKELEPEVTNALLEVIAGEDFFAAFTAINQLRPVHLSSELLQVRLYNLYQEINYNLRKSLIEKLKEAPVISQQVIEMSRGMLTDINGEQLGYMLELYDRHSVYDPKTCHAVAVLLNSDNGFIVRKAYNFLIGIPDKNEEVSREIDKYQQSEIK